MIPSESKMWLKTAILVVTMVTFAVARDPVRHLVGGNEKWKPNFNYTNWSLSETFYVGDWLYFVYDKHMFNVLEVNETSYEKCRDQGFIFNITRGGGRDVFELVKPKPYYFLSSGGYCYGGMKVAVNVVEFVPPPQLPPVTPSACYMITGIKPLILSIMILVWAAVFV